MAKSPEKEKSRKKTSPNVAAAGLKEAGPKKARAEKKTPSKAGGAKPSRGARSVPVMAKKHKHVNIVGIGASAGGLEAFEKFFSAIPDETGMAFVLMPHLDPKHVSILPEILQGHSQMKVLQAADGMKVEANHVYVAPSNADMTLRHGILRLEKASSGSSGRMPINLFFRSLAEDQKHLAICVVLSGMGTDGAIGLKAVKQELGLVMVQDPKTAKFDGMPTAAIDTELADYVLPPEKMGEQLIDYVKRTAGARLMAAPVREPTQQQALERVFALLRARTGHDFSMYKSSTMLRRIERRMNVNQIDTVSNYVRFMQQTARESEKLFQELLIGVTNFFRDPEAFDTLKRRILPQLIRNRPDGYTLRIWIPGCSSGEEAYSMAILLRETFDRSRRNLSAQIFATDIDLNSIEVARAGIYPAGISNEVSALRLQRYFSKQDTTFRIRKEIREMIVFAPQDIIKDPPFTKLDVICCRNLLIYFDSDLQRKLIPLFHFAMKPDGILFLGSSENIGPFTSMFTAVDKRWKIYRRKDTPDRDTTGVEFPVIPVRGHLAPVPTVKTRDQGIAQLLEKVLVRHFSPACAVINEAGSIVYIHGRVSRYLEPATGVATLNIVEMAREGLKIELNSAIRKAVSQKKEVKHTGLVLHDNGSPARLVNITVRPVTEIKSGPGMFVVVFEDIGSAPPLSLRQEEAGSRKRSVWRVRELEQELKAAKETLHSTIEELEASNEELKSTNEELQSTNEEIQSANEELESSKEELQSLNEELVTVNAELQNKIDELSASSSDMRNLLDSIGVPMIFLDDGLRVKRFSSNAAQVINLIATDVGRPIHHIVTRLKYDRLVEDSMTVLRTRAMKDHLVETVDGHAYLMRILPYRNVDNTIDGVVITFLDIHGMRPHPAERPDSSKKAGGAFAGVDKIVGVVREPLVTLSADLRVTAASDSFYALFMLRPEVTLDHSISSVGRGWKSPRIREMLSKVLKTREPVRDFIIEEDFPPVGRKRLNLSASCISNESGDVVLLSIQEIPIAGGSGRAIRKNLKKQ